MDDIYRLTVSVCIGKGSYGYDRIADREFVVTAPRDVLDRIDMTQSIEKLFAYVLAEIDAQEDESCATSE